MSKLTRSGVAAGAAVVVVLGASAAWAWTIGSGIGTTSVKAAGIQDLTAHAGPDPVTGLSPTGTAPLVVTVVNDNTFPVRVTAIAVDRGGVRADAAHEAAGCTAPKHGVTTTKFQYAPTNAVNRVAGAKSRLVLSFPAAVTMAADSPDACAGAEFTIPIEVSAETP